MDLPSWARVGAKVVCVTASFEWTGKPTFRLWLGRMISGDPKKGKVYVIKRIEIDAIGPWLWVGRFPIPYRVRNFRPVVPLKADIATHFAHHLDTKVTEKA